MDEKLYPPMSKNILPPEIRNAKSSDEFNKKILE